MHMPIFVWHVERLVLKYGQQQNKCYNKIALVCSQNKDTTLGLVGNTTRRVGGSMHMWFLIEKRRILTLTSWVFASQLQFWHMVNNNHDIELW